MGKGGGMPGYKQTGKVAESGEGAGRIDQGAVPMPCGHDDSAENTTPGTPKPIDKPPEQYTANEAVPSMERSQRGVPEMDNYGDYSKKFA